MKREKVIELAKKAGFDVSTTAGILQLGVDTGDDWFSCREEVLELVRLVEQETLERAAAKLDEEAKRGGYGTWDNMRPSTFIRNLKDDHDKE